jgi:hypothetical protein
MHRIWIFVIAALLFGSPAALAQDEARAPTVDKLMAAYQKATSAKEKQVVVTQLFARGEPAWKQVEGTADEARTRAEAMRKAQAETPASEQAETIRALEATARHMGKLRDALYMEIVANAFRQVEKKHGLNLIFAGQFEHLKKFGPRAVRGAMLLMKDIDLHPEGYHRKAWEVVADVGTKGDKAVLAELKDISTDFLMEDEIQDGAVYAMAVLGDTSGLERKIKEYQERAQEDPRQSFPSMEKIASIYYHSRQYKKSAGVYFTLIQQIQKILEANQDKLSEKQKVGYGDWVANLAYNCACSLSLDKNFPGAYSMLALCLKNDSDVKKIHANIQRDGDLKNLREHEAFKAWFEDAKKGKFPDVPPGAKPVDPEKKAEPPAGEAPPVKPAEQPPVKEPGKTQAALEPDPDPETAPAAPVKKKLS